MPILIFVQVVMLNVKGFKIDLQKVANDSSIRVIIRRFNRSAYVSIERVANLRGLMP